MQRLTRRDLVIDAAMTVGFLGMGVFEYLVFGQAYADNSVIESTRGPEPLLLLLTVLTILPLAIRRLAPITSVALGHIGYVLTTGLDFQAASSAQFSLFIPFFGLALYTSRRTGDVARGVVTVLMVGWVAIGAIFSDIPSGLIPLSLMAYVATWIIGNNARARQHNTLLLQERALRAEQDRERESQRAVQIERQRIARELHDVVAHGITVMTVQATGAKRVLETKPQQARAALDAIEATGRQALGEMRRMVGVMRSTETENTGLTPQPGLTGLPELFEFVEASGIDLDWSLEGQAVALPPGVELTAYRVVQEALTNTMKHGGPNAHADVTVRFDADGLLLEVIDDGRGAVVAQSNGEPTGQGILGMRERVALYGGTLAAGPRAGGGFAVTARIPVEVPA